MTHPPRPRHRSDFEIAIICALRSEADAVEALFDNIWDEDGDRYGKAQGDINTYRTGVIGCHNVVLAFMPGIGTVNATNVAASFRSSFGGIKLALVVGICGGVPNSTDDVKEILLGDVIISDGLIQYDFGRQLPDKFDRKNTLNDNLGRPNPEIRSLLAKLKGHGGRTALRDKTAEYLTTICEQLGAERARYPGAIEDKLFLPTYRHKHHKPACDICAKCERKEDEVCKTALDSLCSELDCDSNKLLYRSRPSEGHRPVIHFGLIASGNSVIKSAEYRDEIATREGIIAFEMEGAGVWDNLPCIVIKGVCDYADSHKNKMWQGYAAATAAACTKAVIRQWVTTDKPPQVGQPHGSWFIVPYTSNPDFVGRSSVLDKLQKYLIPKERQTSQARAALYGLGGIGKTQVALAHAYWIRKEFPEVSVFWVHASNRERFSQAFSHIAQICQIPGYNDPKVDICSLVKAWLERNDQHPWLMIIDSADNTNIFFCSSEVSSRTLGFANPSALRESIGSYIPECSHGMILVTTRNKQTGVRLTRGRVMIEIPEMDPKESSQLIYQRLEDDNLNQSHVDLLTTRLENIPLALVQAAAFIKEYSLTLIEYLQLLEKSDSTLVELLSEPFEEVGRDSSIPNAVTATWMVSFEQIKQQYHHASDLLSLMSFFDRQGIPKLFLSYYSNQRYSKEGHQSECPADGLLELEKALGILKAFSFISEVKENKSLNIHRLVHLVMQKWLIREGMYSEWASQALSTISNLYPYGHYENWTVCEDYLPHAFAILSFKGLSSSNRDTIAKASLQHRVAGLMLGKGQWKKAEELLIFAVMTRKMTLGQEHADTLTSMANLASTYRNQGRWKEAEELEVQVMETRKRVLGQEHPDTLTSMANLARIWKCQDRNEEAVELMTECARLRIKILGANHPYTMSSIITLIEWESVE